MTRYLDSGAHLSDDQRYRYTLWREWPATSSMGRDVGARSCVFIMLNPSTADASLDDPTIRRCVRFADRFGYSKLVVVNLFAYRTSSPAELKKVTDDPVGPDNERCVKQSIALGCGWGKPSAICAWGSHGSYLKQDERVLGWLRELECQTFALGLTNSGQPRHPLYLPNDSELIPYG